MVHGKKWKWPHLRAQDAVHAARTAAAAAISLEVANLLKLPEPYWATITTLIVMQSTLGAALAVSEHRFAGTALGAGIGASIATYFSPSLVWFAIGVFLLGIICSAIGLDKAAYRFAGITLAIVLLVSRAKPGWVIAVHRFVEVSMGILVGLIFTALGPGEETAPSGGQ